MLILIAALRRELIRLKPLIKIDRIGNAGGYPLVLGEANGLPIALVQTGIGRDRATEASQAVIKDLSPEAVVSIGFAGGVDPSLKAGDLILADQLYPLDISESGHISRTNMRTIKPDKQLLEIATPEGKCGALPTHRGNLVTFPRIASPVMKKSLWSRFAAQAVEMESYWIATIMNTKGIPFLAVRAIVDEPNDALPNYGLFEDTMGTINAWHAIGYFLTHPGHLLTTPKLASSAHKASNTLGKFTEFLLSNLKASRKAS